MGWFRNWGGHVTSLHPVADAWFGCLEKELSYCDAAFKSKLHVIDKVTCLFPAVSPLTRIVLMAKGALHFHIKIEPIAFITHADIAKSEGSLLTESRCCIGIMKLPKRVMK
jgi:hypothetical protein